MLSGEAGGPRIRASSAHLAGGDVPRARPDFRRRSANALSMRTNVRRINHFRRPWKGTETRAHDPAIVQPDAASGSAGRASASASAPSSLGAPSRRLRHLLPLPAARGPRCGRRRDPATRGHGRPDRGHGDGTGAPTSTSPRPTRAAAHRRASMAHGRSTRHRFVLRLQRHIPLGYRVQEELAGIGAKTAVGRTPDVTLVR